MAVHREQAQFVIRVDLTAEFPEDYEGDDDGNAWLQAWRERVQPRLLRAVFAELRSEPGYSVVPASRGKNPEDEVEIAVTFRPSPPTRRG
jgi:hypothetical protein